ncbi:MAG: DUF6268 family outer membrane beta-barrel protein [Bacteroidota bacterium]
MSLQWANAQVTGEVNVMDNDFFYIQYLQQNEFLEGVKYQKGTARFSFPMLRREKFSVFSSLGFDSHDFNFEDTQTLGSTNDLERFYNANISTVLQYKLSDKWSINAVLSPFLISNFEGGISSDNFNFNGNAFVERTFIRKNGGYYLLGFGIGYMTLNGTTQVTPITQLKARLNEKWSFVLGLPNAYLKWDFHEKNSLKLLGDLNDFTAKLNTDSGLLNDGATEELVFTTISGGIEYNFWFTDSFGLMVKGTYPVWGNYELRDGDGNMTVDFDADFNQPFFSLGIKFNPIRKLQNSLRKP